MQAIKELICHIFGHNYMKTVYADRRYDVYMCTRCGKLSKIIRYDAWRYR